MMRVNYTNVGIAISLFVVCFIFFRLAQRSHLLETQLRSTGGNLLSTVNNLLSSQSFCVFIHDLAHILFNFRK